MSNQAGELGIRDVESNAEMRRAECRPENRKNERYVRSNADVVSGHPLGKIYACRLGQFDGTECEDAKAVLGRGTCNDSGQESVFAP